MARPSSRRDFLTGKSAADALGDLTAPPTGGVPVPSSAGPPQEAAPRETYLLHLGREAMACQFEALLNAGQFANGPEAALAALDRVDELEAQLTVYRDLSEVMHLNKTAFRRPVPVETSLFQLLSRAKQLSAEVGGAFDVTSGPLTKVWGFYRRQGRMPSDAEIAAAVALVGSELLELNPEREEVRFLREGMELNLGACGKGYALDQAAETLLTAGVTDFCLHGGMSSVIARGKRLRGGEDGWKVALRHPLKPDARLAEFVLRDQALGTSGSGTQFFHHGGKRYGHILDPRSGRPAEGTLAATVIAPQAELSDALSTAFYVLGLDAAGEYLKSHPEIGALLVTAADRSGKMELHPFNLPEGSWRTL